MWKNFKRIGLVMFLALLVVGLAGCGGKTESKEKKTLTVGFWKGDSTTEDAARKKAFSKFTDKTGIAIKEKVYNDYDTQLMTDFVGGTAPDVFYVDASSIPTFYEQGALEPLDKYIDKQKDYDAADFYEPIYKAFKGEDGATYGVPKDYSTLGFYYNEDLLAKAGMSSTDIPKDYSELEGFLTKLKEKLPDVQPMVFSALLARQVYIAESTGGKIVDKEGHANLNDKKVVEALQILVDLYKKGLIRTADDLGDGWAGDTFGRGGAVISDEGTWMISHLTNNFKDLKWGVTELPTVNGKKGNMAYTVSYSMNSGSKNKDDAWKLINFLTHDAMADYASEASVLPTRKSVADKINVASDEHLSPFAAAADYATPWQDGPYLSLISSRYDNMITSALKGEMPLEKAMKEASDSANQDIENQMK